MYIWLFACLCEGLHEGGVCSALCGNHFVIVSEYMFIWMFACLFANLQSNGMLVFPLHVVDVPGHACHGVDGFLHYLIALLLWVKVLGYLLQKEHNSYLN